MLSRSSFKRKEYVRPPPSRAVPIRQVAPTVISSTPVAMPKHPRYADRHLLDMARGEGCLLQTPLCNHNCETTVACHGSGVANGKGMGYKVGDQLTVWGCSDCNHYTDAYSGATADEKVAAFDAGHARQVRMWADIVCNPVAPLKDRISAQNAIDKLANDFTT